jgi:hypothetical protein
MGKSLFITVLLACITVGFFFGKVIPRLNDTFFAPTGDGLQAYYTALYHTQHDTTYWRMNGMNYPYGEQVFFTGCQPLVTNLIKLAGLATYTVGILNGLMLLSIVLCAAVLYLIFRRLDISPWLSVSGALCITFGSPQLARIIGHFSLAYSFAIPLFIYLWMIFREKQRFSVSIGIGALVLFLSATHFYFFGFFALIAVTAWGFFLLTKHEQQPFLNRLTFAAVHFFVQIILPFVLLRVFIASIDTVTDRTDSPWGFFQYKAIPETIFYPFGYWYDIPLFRRWFTPSLNFEWEGVSFVGIIGLTAAVTSLIFFLKSIVIIRQKRMFLPFKKEVYNILFYASLSGFLLAVAWPFSVFDQWLYNHVGYFKQLRGIARFAWITYYGLGIIGIFLLHEISTKYKAGFLPACALLMISATEAYRMVHLTAEKIPAPLDEYVQNTAHPDYAPLATINPTDFQAIIPLPYFHIGSENVWLAPEGRIYGFSYMSSLFTGLPLTSVLLNRNSIRETFEHLRMIQEPSGDAVHFAEKNSRKPYLIIREKERPLSAFESEMTDSATLLGESPSLQVYRLKSDYFRERRDAYQKAVREYKPESFFRQDAIYSTDSIKNVLHLNYPGEKEETLKKRYVLVYKGILPIQNDSGRMSFSLRILNFYTDLIPRTSVLVSYPEGGKTTETYYSFQQHLVSTQDGTGLIEFFFDYPQNREISFYLVNFDITDNRKIRWHSLLIKPEKTTVWFDEKNTRMLNNRIVSLSASEP